MIEPGENTLLDLVITGPGALAAVTIRRAQRLYAPLPVLEAEFSDLICEVRLLSGRRPGHTGDLVYNRDGRLRFFRIDETGLVELARDGTPLTVRTTPAKKPYGREGTDGSITRCGTGRGCGRRASWASDRYFSPAVSLRLPPVFPPEHIS